MKSINVLLIGTCLSANVTDTTNVETYEYSILGLVLFLIVLTFLYIKEKSKSKKIIELDEKIKTLDINLVEKEYELNESYQNSVYELQSELSDKNTKIAELETQKENLEEVLKELKKKNEDLDKELSNSGINYKKELNDYENKLKISSNKLDSAMNFMTKKYEEYVLKKDEIQRLKDENLEIKIKNEYLANQYINVDSINYIQELSLLKIKMKTREFKNIPLESFNPKNKNRYHGVFDINFTIKLGFDINKLRAEINGDTIDIYNIELKNHGTDGFPDIKPEISEIRRWNKDMIGEKGQWEIRSDDKEFSEYEGKEKEKIYEKIAQSNDYIIQFEDVFYKAVRAYFTNIIGKGFKLNIHKEDKKSALPYAECMQKYNRSLESKKNPEREIKEDILTGDLIKELNNELEKIKDE